MSDRLTIGVTAELKEFERRLALMPEIGGKEAKALASQIRRELKDAEGSAEGSARKIASALGGSTDIVEKGLRKLGPIGNEVADVLTDFVAPLWEAGAGVAEVTSGMGTAGAAATAAGVAVVGVAAAVAAVAIGAGLALAGVVALTNAAVGAADRLEAMGQSSRIPDGAREALDQYQGATQRLWNEVDVLTVQLGSALAPALTVLADLVADAIEWFNNLDKSFDQLRAGIDGVIGMLPRWARWQPAIDLVKGAVDSLEESYDELKATANEAKLAPTQAEIDRWKDLAAARREADEDENARRRQEMLDALDAELEEAERVGELLESTSGEVLDPQVWSAQLERVESYGEAVDKVVDSILRQRVAEQAATDATRQGIETRRDLYQKELGYVTQGFEAASSAVTELTSQVIDGFEARLAAGDKVGRKERERAEDALELQKVLQLASLTASAVATWFAMTRDLALIPGNALGAPFEAAGIVAASMIGPASQILGQEIPFVSSRSGDGGYTGDGQSAVRKDDDYFRGQDDGKDGESSGKGGELGGKGDQTARTSGGSVTVSVTFSDGRVGKRSIR